MALAPAQRLFIWLVGPQFGIFYANFDTHPTSWAANGYFQMLHGNFVYARKRYTNSGFNYLGYIHLKPSTLHNIPPRKPLLFWGLLIPYHCMSSCYNTFICYIFIAVQNAITFQIWLLWSCGLCGIILFGIMINRHCILYGGIVDFQWLHTKASYSFKQGVKVRPLLFTYFVICSLLAFYMFYWCVFCVSIKFCIYILVKIAVMPLKCWVWNRSYENVI